MSLISDALKRQEQLRAAPGAGAARSEVAAARPPEVAAAVPPEVAAARPPEVAVAAPPEVAAAVPPEVAVAAPPEASRGIAAPSFAASAAQLRAATPRPASPPQGAQPRAASPRPASPPQGAQPRAATPRPASPPQGAQPRRLSGPTVKPSNRQTVKPVGGGVPATNPFLERERAAARRSNPSVLLMPILGIIVLLVLLFLRREFVPQERDGIELPHTPRKVEETAAEPMVLSHDDGAHGEDASAGRMPALPGGDTSAGRMPALPGGDTSAGRMPALPGNGENSHSLGASDSSAAPREKSAPPQPSNRQTVKPSNQAVEAEPQPHVWPAFTLTGIAVGREKLAILSTGEMLLAGETSKCGVKVEKVNASTVVFAWGGETKTLRKGEHSDKPAD